MNAIIEARKVMAAYIAAATSTNMTEDALRADLAKLTKAQLIDKIVEASKTHRVKIEDVVKPILADEACSWLTLEDIADAVAEAMNSNTSARSVADYSSKYPAKKGWLVVPRKSNRERNEELKKLLNQP
jgi:uncharacterized protein (DUF433 family)